MSKSNEYDLACSLGANCSAAHQLKFRNLRRFALPFDWTYMKESECLRSLADGFRNNFANFLLKENLQKLEGTETSAAHSDKVQYKDVCTKLHYYNHFTKELNDNGEYEKVKQKFDKRINRFLSFIDKSDRILFILSSGIGFEIKDLHYFVDTICELYPNKNINIRAIFFGQEKDAEVVYKNCEIFYYKRKQNLYDFVSTNYEWSFLDDIKLADLVMTESPGVCNVKKCKKGIMISLFPNMNALLNLKIYFLGLRLNFLIGKDRGI